MTSSTLVGLFNRKDGGVGTLEDAVHESGGLPERLAPVGRVLHQAPLRAQPS
jgi:hypothetical protein